MERSSGILMHISSLYNDYGIGAFDKNCIEFIDFLKDSGFSYWQVLPFCMPDDCNSPYKSYSTFSVNPYFISLDDLYARGLITKEELDSERQQSPHLCEFDRLNKTRLNLLKKASQRFEDKTVIDNFLAYHNGAKKFCEFMAIKQNNNGLWNIWTNQKIDTSTYYMWGFIEYIFFFEWKAIKKYANNKGISIIGDIPIYVDFQSSDVWANKNLFQLDDSYNPKKVAGVPPDYFSADGQLWGNPLYDWKAMKEDGYSWWKQRLEFMCELFDGVRIDHFRAFESYYSVPSKDTNARNGKWVKGPGIQFINEIKKVTKGKLIIAEDLGVITEKVRKLVDDSGFPGMRVFEFAFLDNFTSPHLPHNYIQNCVVYTGTHDNNTLLGWVWEMSNDERNKLFEYIDYKDDNWDNVYDKIQKFLLASTANLVIFPIQDILKYGKDTRMNKPGKSEDNWAIRITRNQLDSIDKQKLKNWNTMYSRIVEKK